MLKVVIVDDEALVRLGLQSMLRWEELGYEIVGEATNGQQGLDLIMQSDPDIVITDIKMPVMDGLEMMRLAAEAGRNPRFIVLSGYDEFQLVKRAMKLGAEEYLIKLDLEPNTLAEALAAARVKALAQRDRATDEKQLTNAVGGNMHLLRESFFRQIISRPDRGEAELKGQAEYLGMKLRGMIVCAVIRINNMSVLDKYDDEEVHSFEASIRSTVNEIVNDSFEGYTFAWNRGEFVAIFCAPSAENATAQMQKAGHTGDRIVQVLNQYFNVSVSVGISDPFERYSQIAPAYFEACRAAQQCYYTGDQSVLFFSDVPGSCGHPDPVDVSCLSDALAEAIELHDVQMIGKVFEALINLVNEPNFSRKQAYDVCFQIAYSISGSPGLADAQFQEILGGRSLHETILGLGTLAQIVNWLIGLEQRLCRLVAREDEQGNRRLIAKAKKYILDHYMERVSLEQVASAINISPGYLSTIFRQSTETCFTDYVTGVKIDQAKRLLRETDYKVYEVSEMLGYQNAYYFSKVFKKIVGMTPSEYSGKVF
jgi:two-component system response regulator YesN